jgi:membrane protease YdiL (CAAX protease family)
MNDRNSDSNRRLVRWAGLIFAFGFPALITWAYFVFSSQFATSTQQTVYLTVKIIQFAFPAVWSLLVLREPLRTGRPTLRGLVLGAVFSMVVVAAGIALFEFVLRGLPVFAKASDLIHEKIGAFGIDSPAKFFVLAGFYSLVHSLLEEYYWRWFVFRQSRCVMRLWPAILFSAVGFTLHHIVVLSVFFKGQPLLVALLAIATGVGGAFWAWLYERTGSIFDTWLSHLLIDAGLFFGIGYPLVRHLLV